jgi:hypothetical protein
MPLPLEPTADTASMMTYYGDDDDFTERIVSSAKNQSSFLWHVNWPEYGDQKFLEESVTRYEMMLRLMKHHPKMFIVPTYDMDVIWHTHLAFPSQYLAACQKIAGRTIHHDDDVGHDRSPAGFLSTNAAKTEQIWQAAFGSAWRKEGAMYRGEPPPWFWEDRVRAAAKPAGPTLSGSGSQARGLFNKYIVHVAGLAFGALGEEVGLRDNFLRFVPALSLAYFHA